MRSTLSFFALVLAAMPSLVSAHGFVSMVTVGGKQYQGNAPQAPTKPSAIRQITDTSPVKGATNPAVNCGPGAKPGSDVISANAGDKISFEWKAGGDGTPWPHNTGPMLTYMASCGATTCDKFDSTQAKWFKIDQVGRNGNDWAQAALMKGSPATVTIPASLKAGNYLIRHEIIALHLATSKGGAEFYPSCTQLKVGGSGTAEPKPNELVSLPGAYSDNDPGIFDPNVFDTNAKYQFPGPPVASLVSGGGSGGGDSGSGSGAPPADGAKPKSGKSKKDSDGSCHLKRGSANAKVNAVVRPRRLSRVMRGVTLQQHHGNGHH